MIVAQAYTLLFEVVVVAASFALFWLSFWFRDRRRNRIKTDRPRVPGVNRAAVALGREQLGD